jgi:hypothetical protein
MALKDRADIGDVLLRGPRCGVDRVLRGLNQEDRQTLIEWLDADSGRESEWIARQVRAEGHDLSGETVARHRRRICRCA